MTKTPGARSSYWEIALFVAAAATAVPLWCARFLPFADMPQQVAAMGILRHYWDPSFGLGAEYTWNLGDSQYILYQATGALISLVTGDVESANRVLLTAIAVAFPYALRSLLVALRRDPRLALFGAPAFWSAPLMMGFLPYVAAVPVTLFGLALFIRQVRARAPSLARGIGVVVVATALVGLHLSAFLVFAVVAGASAVVVARGARATLKALVCLAPNAILSACWAVRGSLAAPQTARLDAGQVHFAAPHALARELPIWAHDVWRSHVDEACSVVLWVAFIALIFQRGHRAPDVRLVRAAWIPLSVAALAYAFLPYNIGAATMLDLRMASFIVLFAPLVLSPSKGLRGSLPLIAVLASHAVSVVDSAYEVRATEREEVGDLDRLLDRIPRGKHVLTLPIHLMSAHTHWPPWAFVGGYHVARAGGRTEMSFTVLRHWPFQDRVPPPPDGRPLFWTLGACDFRNAVDGPRVEYVLARAPMDIFRAKPRGPAWRKIDAELDWTLYERDDKASWDGSGGVDPGPCAP